MSFSMFVQSRACSSALRLQLQRVSSPPTHIQRTIYTHRFKWNDTLKTVQPVAITTIFDSTRSFGTSAVHRRWPGQPQPWGQECEDEWAWLMKLALIILPILLIAAAAGLYVYKHYFADVGKKKK